MVGPTAGRSATGQHEPSSEAGGGLPTGPSPRKSAEEIGAEGLALRRGYPDSPPDLRFQGRMEARVLRGP